MMTYADADAAALQVEGDGVERVAVLAATSQLMVLEITAREKYPHYLRAGRQIRVYTSDQDLPALTATVTLPPRTDGWMIMTDDDQYDIIVAAIPRGRPGSYWFAEKESDGLEDGQGQSPGAAGGEDLRPVADQS
jgi:hypothetical protein